MSLYLAPFNFSAFEDAIATGRLGLIADTDLREAIQRAYGAIERLETALAPYRDEYLKGIRGWIPQRMIEQLRAACPWPEAPWECALLEFSDQELGRILQHFSSDQVQLAFRLRHQGLFLTRFLLEKAMKETEDVLARLKSNER